MEKLFHPHKPFRLHKITGTDLIHVYTVREVSVIEYYIILPLFFISVNERLNFAPQDIIHSSLYVSG